MNVLFAGSYFRSDISRSLGAVQDAVLPFADQTLLGIIQAQPSLVYSEWATQVDDVTWTPAAAPVDYQAYAIADQQIVATVSVATAAPQVVAVISPVLAKQSALTAAFQGTPYEYQKTEAVYAQADAAEPPQVFFLYWLELRSPTDPKTGNTSLNAVAAALTGVLIYVLEIPPPGADRSYPTTPFTQALALQLQKQSAPLTIPQTPAQQATVPVTPVATPATTLPSASPSVSITPASPASPASPTPATPPAAASTKPGAAPTVKAIVLVGLGTTAALAAYHFASKYWSRNRG